MENSANLEEDILQMAKGDMGAFEHLYRACEQAVFSYTLNFTKNFHLAKDTMQETFLKVYRAAPSYQPQGKPMAFILRIAKNEALMVLRKESRENLVDFQEDVWGWGSYEDHTEEQLLLKGLLVELEDKPREIVLLHVIAGLKHKEIASFLQMPLGTVLWHYRQSIKKLNAILEKEGGML